MDKLKIYCLYNKPSDFPEWYVVRAFTINETPEPDRDIFFLSVNLWVVYDHMTNLGLVIIPRSENDDPCIICSFI